MTNELQSSVLAYPFYHLVFVSVTVTQNCEDDEDGEDKKEIIIIPVAEIAGIYLFIQDGTASLE